MVFTRKKRKIKPRTKKRQQVKGSRIGLLASAAAALLGEIAKPIFQTIFTIQTKLHYQTEKPSIRGMKERADEIYWGNWTKTATD